jgi:hypothetical protein
MVVNTDAQTIARLRREVQEERAGRLKATQKVAGLTSANRRLRLLVLDARVKIEKLKLGIDPSAKAKGNEGARASP